MIKGKSAKEAEAEFAGQTQYGEFKGAVANTVAEFLADFQAKLAEVSEDEIMTKLADSEKQMREKANQTLLKVQKTIGLR